MQAADWVYGDQGETLASKGWLAESETILWNAELFPGRLHPINIDIQLPKFSLQLFNYFRVLSCKIIYFSGVFV